MIFYHVADGRTTGRPDYYPTLADAHRAAKEFFDRFEVLIYEVDLPSDKAGILRLANGDTSFDWPPRRVFTLSPRGGLREESEEAIAALHAPAREE